jgi:hypothetical protein
MGGLGMAPHFFEIFAGTIETGAVWVESAIGLEIASSRMNTLARTRPGKYFVFDSRNNQVVAKTNTAVRAGENPLQNKAASIN